MVVIFINCYIVIDLKSINIYEIRSIEYYQFYLYSYYDDKRQTNITRKELVEEEVDNDCKNLPLTKEQFEFALKNLND